MADDRRPAGPVAPDVGTLIRVAAALGTAAAGLGHLSAARDHPAHPHIATFFVVVALAQLAWAAAAVLRPSDRLLRLGIAGNGAVVLVWIASRTTGLPGIAGATRPEAVAVKDITTTLLEIAAVAALGLLLAMPEVARRATLASPDRAFTGLVAGVLVLLLPATLGGHGHGPSHGAHGHAAAAHSEAGGVHSDDAPGAVHSHSGQVASTRHEHVGHDAGFAPAAHGTHAFGQEHALGAGGGGSDHASHGTPGHGPGHHGNSGGSGGSAGLPPWPDGAAATVRYGPFTLPPASVDPIRGVNPLLTNVILTDLEPPCRDCYVLAMEPDLVYGDGSRANFDTGAMLHHTVLFDSAREDLTCARSADIGGLGMRVFASGNERTRGVFPDGFGIEIGGGDWWSGIFEIMNLTDQPQTVWFTLHVRHVPADSPVKPLTPVWLDVDNCEDSEYDVPAGRSSTTWDWTSTITGRVVATAGHVHDGGVSITLSNASTSEHQCRSVAGYGNDPAFLGTIDTMSLCSWDRLGTVRKGEKLSIETVYDTPEALEGVMGIMMAFVYETDDLEGGSRAPRSMTEPDEVQPPPPSGHHH